MKTNLKYLFLGMLILMFGEVIGQKTSSPTVEAYQNFSEEDFDLIVNRYNYSPEIIKNLYGIVILNGFSQINPKFEVRLQIHSESIEFIGVYQNGVHCRVSYGMSRFNSFYGNHIHIDYFFKGKLIYFNYKKMVGTKEIESIYSDRNRIEYIQFNDKSARSQNIDKLTELRTEGHYQILEEVKVKPDTLISFNQFAYEEWISIRRNNLEKIGIWQTYDKEGNLVKTEEFKK